MPNFIVISRIDGGVSITRTLPCRAIDAEAVEYRVLRFFKIGNVMRIVVSSNPDVSDLEENETITIDMPSVDFDAGINPAGHEFVYPDVDGEIAKWKSTSPDQYLSHREMPYSAIPEDRTFRNAWCDTTPELVIDHDMDKCREIHKGKLRDLRRPLIDALDVEYMRADEAGDTKGKKSIAAKKQALRDVTKHPDISKAKTPDELKAIIPAVLI